MDNLKPIWIKITNFQSIDSLEFEIRGFTCITGKSNVGKSAIVRAIKGSLLNDPVTSSLRKGTKFCTVIQKSEDWSLRWEKGSGVSRYFIPFDADQPLDKVGAGQIEPIAKMGFQAIEVGRKASRPWLAKQFESLFLLNESGASVTDFISEVSRLQVLQDAISISNKSKKKANEELKVRSSDLVGLRERVQKVEGVANLEKVSREIEQQAESIRDYEKKIVRANEVSQKIGDAVASIENLEGIDRVSIPENEISEKISELRGMENWNASLVGIANSVIALRPVGDVKIPAPPTEELEELKKAEKYAHISALEQSVETLSAVKNVKVPAEGDLSALISDLKKSTRAQDRLERDAQALRAFDQDVKIPSLDVDIEKLVLAEKFRVKISREETDLAKFDERETQLLQQIKDIEADIAKIPSCVTCGRVAAHQHS